MHGPSSKRRFETFSKPLDVGGRGCDTNRRTQGADRLAGHAAAELLHRERPFQTSAPCSKPFSDERFASAVTRAKTRVRKRRLAQLATALATVSDELHQLSAAGPPKYSARLSFKQGDHAVLVNIADVIWIEAEDYYVLVHTRGGRHMVRATLASFEERLDPKRFARVHRAALVNIGEMREVHDTGGLLLVLSDGSRVPVSRSRRKQIEPLLRTQAPS